MDFNYWKYKLEDSKDKLLVLFGIVAVIVVGIILLNMFGVDIINKNENNAVAEKYVLAKGIFGANNNGEINYYNLEDGKVLDSKKLDGERFIYSPGSTLDKLYAYDLMNSKIYEIEASTKKIQTSKAKNLNLSSKSIINFKTNDKYFVGLLNDEKTFVSKNISWKKENKISLGLTDKVDSYAIVKNNLIVTSGNYIYTIDLSNNKQKKIEIGESSLSITVIKDKVYIHNAFGYERGKSILLDINPSTLYINNMHQFKDSNVNILKTSSNTDRIYYSEEFLTSEVNDKVSQVFKYMGEDMKNPVMTMKYVSEYSVANLNAYGNLGYIYTQEKDKLKVFSLKSHQEEYSIQLIDDMYMPIY